MTFPDDLDDNALVGRIAERDQPAFQALFDRRVGDVFKLSYSLVTDHQIAEDVTQETFVRLWQNAPTWRPEATIKTWLLTVARNLCLDQIRKRNNDLEKHKNMHLQSVVETAPTAFLHSEQSIDRKRKQASVRDALFALPDRQREAIMLVYFMELQNTEAAKVVGLKGPAFDSLLARARRTLRERLTEDDELKGYFDGTE